MHNFIGIDAFHRSCRYQIVQCTPPSPFGEFLLEPISNKTVSGGSTIKFTKSVRIPVLPIDDLVV